MIRYLFQLLLAVLIAGASEVASAFDGLRITLLGTGSPLLSPESYGPSALVEAGDETLLFDCGRGTMQRLVQAGVPLRDLTAVFLTSLQPEHVAGCGDLWRARARAGGAEPLAVWGPEGTTALVEELDRGSRSVAEGSPAAGTEAHEIGENVAYQTAEVTVTAIVADFPLVPQAFSYRVDYRHRAVVLSGDTRFSENIVRSARGVNVLIHEVAAASQGALENSPQLREVMASHTAPEEAGSVFHAARPYLAVYSRQLLFGVTERELMQRTRRTYRGALELGYDLMIIEVQNEVQIRSSPSDGRRDAQ